MKFAYQTLTNKEHKKAASEISDKSTTKMICYSIDTANLKTPTKCYVFLWNISYEYRFDVDGLAYENVEVSLLKRCLIWNILLTQML